MPPDPQTNVLSYGDNLDILRRYLPDAAVDLVYLDPSINANPKPTRKWLFAGTAFLAVAMATAACSAESNWKATAGMAVPRAYQAAVRLSDGRVLVMGGGSASAEIYDPTSGTWTQTASMDKARGGFTATLLPNGSVLVAGGAGDGSAELYDPGTGAWKATGSMHVLREGFTATLLQDGRVLAAGGLTPDQPLTPSPATEVYDPQAGTWTAVEPMSSGRTLHTATLLNNGLVLVAGGGEIELGGLISTAELFDPASGQWTTTGDLGAARGGHLAALLPDGRVLVASGLGMVVDGEIGLTTAEVYDPATGTWTGTGSMSFAAGIITALPDGSVLVIGLDETQEHGVAALYDPASGQWSSAGTLITPHDSGTATLLTDGRILVVGGTDSNSQSFSRASAELYTPLGGS